MRARRQILAVTVVFEGGLALVAWFVAWLTGTDLWGVLEFTFRDAATGILLAAPAAVVVVSATEARWTPLERIRRDFDVVVKLFKGCTTTDLLLIGVTAGIGEEALFRGVLQPLVGSYTHPLAGLAVASLAFGLVHPISLAYIGFATAMGLYLGSIFLWFDNLLVPMATHGFYDFFVLVYGVRYYVPRPSTEIHE